MHIISRQSHKPSSRGGVCLVIVLFLVALLSTACDNATAVPTPVPTLVITQTIIPAPSQSGVVGQARNDISGQPVSLKQTIVKLAAVVWNDDHTDGAFFLDTGFSPTTFTDDNGFFVISDVKPGDYVMVIGDPFASNAIVAEPNGKAKIFTTEPDKVLNVGVITVKLSR